MELDGLKVKEARGKEIQHINEKQVWKKALREQAQAEGWKVIKTRRIEINKGDDTSPVYRSRFVAKEYNDHEMAGLFVATPALEALRMLLSEAATFDASSACIAGGKVFMMSDVARAFFECKGMRTVCVELPEEDRKHEDGREDMVGLL